MGVKIFTIEVEIEIEISLGNLLRFQSEGYVLGLIINVDESSAHHSVPQSAQSPITNNNS